MKDRLSMVVVEDIKEADIKAAATKEVGIPRILRTKHSDMK